MPPNNPIHHPECDVCYKVSKFDQDKHDQMTNFLTLLERCSNNPAECGIYEDELVEIEHGMGVRSYIRHVIWWEAKPNGGR